MSRHDQWKVSREETLTRGVVPKRRIEVATKLPSVPGGCGVSVQTIRVAAAPFTASDRLFGKLVHGILQDIPLGTGECLADDLLRNVAMSQCRRLGLPDAHARTAANAVAAVLDMPLLRTAAKAHQVLRECPFILRADDGWTVVDCKTGRTDRREYEKQIQVYARALAGHEQRVKGVLVEIGGGA
jgi:hypothetical protein